jgi:hypothetical protein
MSKDVVDLLLENQSLMDNRVLDDLSIGMALKELGVLPIDLPRPKVCLDLKRMGLSYDLSNSTQLWHHPSFRFPNFLTSYPNIRCKDPHQIFGFSIRMDPIIFVILKVALFLRN